MKYLIIDRHTFHKAPSAGDRYATLKACDDYGEVSSPYKVHGSWVLATDHVNGYGVCEIDTPEQLWDIERKYPGTTIEWGNEFEIYPLIDNDDFWEISIEQAKQERDL
jgi:hypothetical protein